MKKIKFLLVAILFVAGISANAQDWTDIGTYSYSNDKIGIGLSTPASAAMFLSVNGPAYFNGALFAPKINAYSANGRFDFGFGPTKGANIELYSNTNASTPGQLRFVFGDANSGSINYLHYDGAAWASCLFVNYDGKIGIGTESPTSKLTVAGEISCSSILANGKITTKEVEVTLSAFPDYVFGKEYQLSPLSEVENYIKANKHLPGIPSAKEVVENGLSLGEMNVKMMEKIEELTLYVIDLEKRISELDSKVQK